MRLFVLNEQTGEKSLLCPSVDIISPEDSGIENYIDPIKSGATATFEVKAKRNDILSLIYGRKITNNYLKRHGGVMSRKGGRK